MKKYFALCLAAVSALTLFGCSSEKNNNNEKEKTKQQETVKKEEKKEETKEKETKKTENENTSLSNDWKDNQIQLKGKVITLPVTLTELKELGFDFEDLGEFVVNANQTAYGKSLKDEQGNTISGEYTNLSKDVVDIRDTSMTSITIRKDYRTEGNKNLDVVLPGNIKFGDSFEDVKAKLGEPTKMSEDGKSIIVKYNDDSQHKHNVELSFWENKLITFILYAQ